MDGHNFPHSRPAAVPILEDSIVVSTWVGGQGGEGAVIARPQLSTQ